MTTPPSGTVTFLLTDIQGSTRLLQELGADTYANVLATHRALLRSAFAEAGGWEVDTQGDAFFVAFASARDAVRAAVAALIALRQQRWPADETVRVRMGAHSGEAAYRGEGYVGIDVHRAARIAAAAHGGQLLISETAKNLLDDGLPGVAVKDLGEHQLKDLDAPVRLFQVVHDDIERDFPPVRSLNRVEHNLPTQPTPLLGRDEEVARACELLRGDVRLLTLTGPGGTGKTRLAVQVAAEMVDDVGGAFLVELAPLADPALLPATIANVVGVHEVATASLTHSLGQYLRDLEVLLVLDNFEHLRSAASVVAELLVAAPTLRVVVTSRVPLRLAAEQEFAVPPLSMPPHGALVAKELDRYGATALFVARARSVTGNVTVNDETAPVVAAICEHLDGLPLAIELAAARTKMFPLPALLTRLTRRLDMLTSGASDAPTRQRTLRATIDWSYQLLTEEQQALFRRLSVFAGGCRIDAAEQVCGDGNVVDGLSDLLDNSLLHRSDDADYEPRFAMLETIREYAMQLLRDHGESQRVANAHVAHFRVLAQSAGEAMWGADQAAWFERLDKEVENIRAALQHSLSSGGGQAALDLAIGVAPYWEARGLVSEGLLWLDQSLQHADDAAPERRGQALYLMSRLAMLQGDPTRTRNMLEASMAAYRAGGDVAGELSALSHLAIIASEDDQPLLAIEQGKSSVALARGLDDPWHLAMALNNLGYIQTRQGDLSDETGRLLQESLQLRRRIGEQRGVAVTLGSLAELRLLQGRLDEVATLLSDMTAMATDLKHAGVSCVAQHLSGLLEFAMGDVGAAERTLHQLLQEAHSLDYREFVAEALAGLAQCAAGRGATARASYLSAAARDIFSSLHLRPGELTLQGLARATEGTSTPSQPDKTPDEIVALELERATLRVMQGSL